MGLTNGTSESTPISGWRLGDGKDGVCTAQGQLLSLDTAASRWQPQRRPWWPWLLLAVGLFLIGEFGLKVWNLCSLLQISDLPSGITLLTDPHLMFELSSALERDMATNAATANTKPSALPDPYLDTNQNIVYPDVTRTRPLPHRQDATEALIGVSVLYIGLGTLARRALRRQLGRACPEAGLATRRPAASIGLTAASIWEFADTLVIGTAALALAWFSYLLLARLTSGSILSWDLMVRVVDQGVGTALTVIGIGG